MSAFERQTGKGVSIIHFGQPWYTNGVPQPFYPSRSMPCESTVRFRWSIGARGICAMAARRLSRAFSLARIIDGIVRLVHPALGYGRARLGTSVLPALRS